MNEKPKVRTRDVSAKLTIDDFGYNRGYKQKVITVSPKKVTFSDWPSESRIDLIGRNGGAVENC